MLFRFPARSALLLCSLLATAAVRAEPADAMEMAERYADAEHCMERIIGKRWEMRYGVELARNQWGALEPTGRSMDSAPQAIRMADMSCRRELSIERQPRP